MGTRQYAGLVDLRVRILALNPSAFGIHSLRRSKAALIHKKTGNLRAGPPLLVRGKLESTVRRPGSPPPASKPLTSPAPPRP